MPAKPLNGDVDDAILRYLSGEGIHAISKGLHVGYPRMRQILLERGVALRPSGKKKLPGRNIAASYLSGASELQLALHYAVSRPVIRRVLLESNVKPRTVGRETMLNTYAQRGDEYRKQVTRAANNARRGRKASLTELEQRALGRQRNKTAVSLYEQLLAAELSNRGFCAEAQLAVGKYNCDLAAFPVAVEVWGGHWHFSGRHFARLPERLREFARRGWTTIIVVVEKECSFASLAEHVIAYAKRARRSPALRGQYRVVGSDGQLCAVGQGDDNDIAIVKTFRDGLNASRANKRIA